MADVSRGSSGSLDRGAQRGLFDFWISSQDGQLLVSVVVSSGDRVVCLHQFRSIFNGSYFNGIFRAGVRRCCTASTKPQSAIRRRWPSDYCPKIFWYKFAPLFLATSAETFDTRSRERARGCA